MSKMQTAAGLSISVVIPCFNEERTIVDALKRVHAAGLGDVEVIVVDDGSTDGSGEILESEGAPFYTKLLRLPRNLGKGAALRAGFAEATKDLVVVQDADLEYDPRDLHKLRAPIEAGLADVVFGSRFMSGDARRVLFFWHSVGNRFLTLFSNVFTNLNLTDMETCYKLVRSDLLKDLPLHENRFGFEPEITAKLAATGARIYEVGISYSGRTYSEGKKINWKDGVRAVYCILKYGIFARPNPTRSNPAGAVLPR